MIEEILFEYFDDIKPSDGLIERTVNMSKNNQQKIKKLSKRSIALLVAAIILLIGVTGYAAVNRIIGDKNDIVSVDTSDGFVFDFSKASKTPNAYSNKDLALVLEINKIGCENVLLPADLLDEPYNEFNETYPFLQENSGMFEFSNSNGNYQLQVFTNMTDEEMNNFYGTGDGNTICEVYQINGIDVCLNMEGDDEVGYYAYIFYATDDTLYCINFFADMNNDIAHDKAMDCIKTLER